MSWMNPRKGPGGRHEVVRIWLLIAVTVLIAVVLLILVGYLLAQTL